LHEVLDEPIAGGARWAYVFGSALTLTFVVLFASWCFFFFFFF